MKTGWVRQMGVDQNWRGKGLGEKLLNHVSGTLSGVAAIYNRQSAFEEMREALATHESFLGKLGAPKG